MSDRDLYSRLLLATGNGYPLSYPQPSDDLPPECQERGLEIGDVGALSSDGSFNVFFNVRRPDHDPVNRFGVPAGFERVDLGYNPFISKKSYHRPGSHVSNTNMNKQRLDVNVEVDNVFLPVGAGAVIELSTTSKQTAVLLLPDGGSRIDLRFHNTFRDLAIKHAQSWYKFVTDLGTMVENGDLYLITGVDKSVSWGGAAERSHTEDGSISLKLSAAQVGSAGGSHAWSWEANSTFADMGPRRPPGEAQSTQNQTVFLRGFKIAIRSLAGRKIPQAILVGDSKPLTFLSPRWFKSFRGSNAPTASGLTNRNTPRNNNDGTPHDEEFAVEFLPATQLFHPANAIVKHILESSPEASVVVIHDDEWTSVLEQNEETLPDKSELIKRIFARYESTPIFGGVYLRDKSRFPTSETTLSVALTNVPSGSIPIIGRQAHPGAAAGQGGSTANYTNNMITVNELEFWGGGFGGRDGAPSVTRRAIGQGGSTADDTDDMMIFNGLKFSGGRNGAPGVTGGRGTGQGGSTANDADNMMTVNGLKFWGGGFGGRNGAAKNREGTGGNGQGPQLAPKYIKDWGGNIVGGFGGLGGRGVAEGGVGGLGERPDFVAQRLYAGEVDEALMDMPLKDFCTQYKLSNDIFDRLRKLGFTTAGALFEIEDGELEKHGFNLGHILELKRVFRQIAAAK
ncbi:hypothetical protein B0H16DRAFT_1899789 [Mycena metata]|uniref:Uncharacterized protein n=1 Tax=Mycena metata TaxID=1033252 RepID=A0AAD7H5X2_9AGAR|nr:hypothetical protein B0H16DRAFT_1899789 [Mycena metata]